MIPIRSEIPDTSIKWEAMFTVTRNGIFLRLYSPLEKTSGNSIEPLGNLPLPDNRPQLSVYFFFYVLFRWFFWAACAKMKRRQKMSSQKKRRTSANTPTIAHAERKQQYVWPTWIFFFHFVCEIGANNDTLLWACIGHWLPLKLS